MKLNRTMPCIVLAAGLVVGCAPGEPGARGIAAGPEPLTEAQIAALKEQYPRLRDTIPLPQPQPNGDAPAAPPAHIAERLPSEVLQTVTGQATFYANYFEGRRTASGIPFRQNQMVAAHRSFPFGTVLRVTNTRNNQSVNVRVVDRGPFGGQGTIIDLSRRAAGELGFIQAGRTPVRVEVLEWGSGATTA
jgi:rare lipoprotein A